MGKLVSSIGIELKKKEEENLYVTFITIMSSSVTVNLQWKGFQYLLLHSQICIIYTLIYNKDYLLVYIF